MHSCGFVLKSHEIKQTHTICSLQNRKYFSVKETTPTGGLYVQTGSERCLLCSSTLSRVSKIHTVKWKGSLYEFLCLFFGLAPAPKFFSKLTKIPITLMRRLHVHLIVYLGDSLIISSSTKEHLTARDT